MTSTGLSQFSLRPWPIGDKKPKNLNDFVSRMSIERGGFRNIPTEVELREDIQTQSLQVARVEDNGVEESSESEDDAEAEADKTKNVWAARHEILMNLDYAHNHSLLALEFVSLLLTKENPSQASATLSAETREMVGIGTLGASKLKDSNMTEALIKDDLVVATGWRLMEVNKMAESIMEEAEKLEKEVALEAKYWADILAIREENKAIYRLPRKRQTLAVKFGSDEAAPQFNSENAFASLRRNDDGSIRLVTGRVGSGSKLILVTILADGQVTGLSHLPARVGDNAPIQLRLREASSTATSQELWHEINREARSLLSLGVNADQSSVTCNFGPRTKILFTLEDLPNVERARENLPHNWLADVVILASLALLDNAHVQNFNRRTHPQPQPLAPNPALNRSNLRPLYAILRPLITYARHMTALMGLMSIFAQLQSLENRAGITAASYTAPIIRDTSRLNRSAAHQARWHEWVASSIIYGMDMFVDITMTPEARVRVRVATHPMPYVRHQFGIILLGTQNSPVNGGNGMIGNSSNVQGQQQQPRSFLESAYPPSTDPYNNWLSVAKYLKNATARALASHLVAATQRRFDDEMRDIGTVFWAETLRGPAIGVEGHSRQVCLSVYHEHEDEHEDQDRDQLGRLVLRLYAQWVVLSGNSASGDGDGEPVGELRTATWFWMSDGTGNANRSGQSLEDVVFQVLAGEV